MVSYALSDSRSDLFFHPDYTVGFGIPGKQTSLPDHGHRIMPYGSWALPPVGNSLLLQSHPALKIFYLFFTVLRIAQYTNNVKYSDLTSCLSEDSCIDPRFSAVRHFPVSADGTIDPYTLC